MPQIAYLPLSALLAYTYTRHSVMFRNKIRTRLVVTGTLSGPDLIAHNVFIIEFFKSTPPQNRQVILH